MPIADQIAPHLPLLRRYARALTGAQAAGDQFVVATLEAIVAEPAVLPRDAAPRAGLYKVFHAIWRSAQLAPSALEVAGENRGYDLPATELAATARLAVIMPRSRQALLLTAMEGFSIDDAAFLLDEDPATVRALVADALDEIHRQTATRVLIIEDESIIAADLEAIVAELGHTVTGVATTHAEALAQYRADPPGLVLADIQLADATSGLDAVRSMLAEGAMPVIFITAFPERLLTGDRVEPAFLIAKPFQPAMVKAAIAQALFFACASPFASPSQ